MNCTSCQRESPPGARFCMHCGSTVALFAAGEAAIVPGHEGERRHITAMFCDLVDSTELSQRLDAEELMVAVGAYQELCGRCVAGQDGTIAQYLGDGLLVYFGYPHAHEDDPVRAVLAALEILREIPALNDDLAEQLPAIRDRKLEVRIGIHTGQVVLGALGDRRDRIAMGDAINITARLQSEAEPGTVVISDVTRRLVNDVFDLEGLGRRALKGIEEPVQLYRVLAGRAGVGRSRAGSTPFVGREQEIALLVEQWELAEQGSGQVALLGGEAGIGKSRLVQVLRERLAECKHVWLEAGCSPYHENSAFHPVLALLRDRIDLRDDDHPEDRARKLEEALGPTGLPLDDVIPVLASLLAVPLPPGYPAPPANPATQRAKILETLAAWLFRVTDDDPVVLVIEDLHWIDPSTLELLRRVVEQSCRRRILLVLTFRPSFEPTFRAASRIRSVSLNPLTRQQMSEMVESIRPGHAWSSELVQRIVSKADGVPLFVEELTRAVLESGSLPEAPPGVAFSVPSTLQSSLTSRLDRLGTAREIVQVASVLGREFSHDLLVAVSPADAAALDRGLAELTRAGLLYRLDEGRSDYAFKHALIRDVAYESLLHSARRRLHRRVAEALETEFPEILQAEPELIARHYEEARLPEEAAPHYQHAAELAVLRSANAESIGHLTRGIDMLGRLAPSAERRQRELGLQVQLGVLRMAARGAADPEVESTFARARDLCVEIGPEPETGLALFGLSVFHQARGELDMVVELGDRLLALAEAGTDSSLRVSAHLSLGIPLFWAGRPANAVAHLERAFELYDPVAHRALAFAYGQDPAVSARSYAGVCLWQLGRSEAAAQETAAAVAAAPDDLSLAFALTWAAWVDQLCGDVDAVARRANEIVAVAEKRGYVLWRGLGGALAGWARAVRDADPAAVEEVSRSLAALAATGTHVVAPAIVGLQAEALAAVGRPEAAVQAIDEALERAHVHKTPFMDPELRRQRADLLCELGAGDRAEVERELRGAFEDARVRGMKGFELRAASSLARFLCGEGQEAEARKLLADACEALRDVGPSRDLRDTEALLHALG